MQPSLATELHGELVYHHHQQPLRVLRILGGFPIHPHSFHRPARHPPTPSPFTIHNRKDLPLIPQDTPESPGAFLFSPSRVPRFSPAQSELIP